MPHKQIWMRLVWIFWIGLGLSSCVQALDADGRLNVQAAPPYRILHVVLRGNSLESAKALVDKAKDSGFNAIQFLLTDGVALDKAPWTPKKNAWSKAQLLDWVAHIRARGLEPILEVKLLTHQEKFLAAKYPELLYNAVSYDPRKEMVYDLVFPFLDEIISNINPKALHIGHDEVGGWNNNNARKVLKEGESYLPASMFLNDIKRLHAYLTKRGVNVWMWGDMLLTPEEFPGMLASHLHGGRPGYGKALRDQLPRDIVICDWHYSDQQREFPSLAKLQSEGFQVIAATWQAERTIRNFSRFALEHNAYGLMATTWYGPDNPKRVSLIEWIVRTSGILFQDPSAIGIEPQPVLDASENPQ